MEFHLRAPLLTTNWFGNLVSSYSKSMEFRAQLLTTTETAINWFGNLASSNSKSMEFHLRAQLLTTETAINWFGNLASSDSRGWNFIFMHGYQLISESGFIEFQMVEFHLRAQLLTETAINWFGNLASSNSRGWNFIFVHRYSYQLIRESGFVEFQIHGISSSCTAINNNWFGNLASSNSNRVSSFGNFIFVHSYSYQLIYESGFIEFQMMEFHLRAPLLTTTETAINWFGNLASSNSKSMEFRAQLLTTTETAINWFRNLAS